MHAFRYIALEIFSAQKFGWNIPDNIADQIIYGDVISTVIAVVAIVTLRNRPRAALWVVWSLVIVTFVDLSNAGIQGATNELFGETYGVPWLILIFTDRDGETLELEADHRRHAEIENAIRDLKYGVGLNHLPSGPDHRACNSLTPFRCPHAVHPCPSVDSG